ncbi:hypothetical protein [Duganella radicis]|uniref:Ion channel protein Tsx n=1 Tax=Duganella radicis TaxID=551988 RepID=A0A6L6PG81_9BURK|nr:hypothetical protein [Duganella radicis]MTV37739.1 hypothetical protein [Duganella radicis]
MHTFCNPRGRAWTLLLGCAATVHAADWSDSAIGLKLGDRFGEPGISQPVEKAIIEYTYVSGDKLGKNLLVGQLLKSDSADPANSGGGGAQELYALYRRTLSLSGLSGQPVAFGPVKDVSLAGRYDVGAKNSPFAPSPRKLYGGVAFDLAVPKGYLELGLYAYHEDNHNGMVGKAVDFDTTYCVDAAWLIPLNLGWQAAWKGIFSQIGKKGADGFGTPTRPETLLHTELLFDLSHSGAKAGLAYEYWRNKFGSDPRVVPGSKANTLMLVAEQHF